MGGRATSSSSVRVHVAWVPFFEEGGGTVREQFENSSSIFLRKGGNSA